MKEKYEQIVALLLDELGLEQEEDGHRHHAQGRRRELPPPEEMREGA